MTSLVSKSSIVSALRGAFVADAASMGTHWIYDPAKMKEAVDSVDAPEFKTPATPSFYNSTEFAGRYEAGMLSPYGEQMLWMLEDVASVGGVEDGQSLTDRYVDWAKNTYTGRKDSATNTLIENVDQAGKALAYPDAGADDNQAHIYMKIVPVVCRYAGMPCLHEKVITAIQFHQKNQMAVDFGLAAAAILEYALLHRKPMPDEEIENKLNGAGKEAWKKARTFKDKDLETLMMEISHELMAGKEDSPFYDLAGRSCALPGSFVAPAFLLQQPNMGFANALRTNILGAGDTCSRAVFLGAVLGVLEKEEQGPPETWISQLDPTVLAKVDAAAEEIYATRERECAN